MFLGTDSIWVHILSFECAIYIRGRNGNYHQIYMTTSYVGEAQTDSEWVHILIAFVCVTIFYRFLDINKINVITKSKISCHNSETNIQFSLYF